MAQSLNILGSCTGTQAATPTPAFLQGSSAIREKALGRDHPDVAISLSNLGFLYRDQGRYADAEPLLRRSLAIFKTRSVRIIPMSLNP